MIGKSTNLVTSRLNIFLNFAYFMPSQKLLMR